MEALPKLSFSYRNTSVANSDGSLIADGSVGAGATGFVIPSDINSDRLGFLGGISMSARNATGDSLSTGYVQLLLEAQ